MLRMAGGEPRAGLSVWRLNQVLTIIQERVQKLSDDERWAPLVWSTLHMHGTVQLSKLVAMKRNLNPEFAALVCAFHDIHTLHTGEYEDHGIKAQPYVVEIIEEYNNRWGKQLGRITDGEVERIVRAIADHSDKLTIDSDPYAELLKDIDSLDAYLHGFEADEESGRLARRNRVSSELGIEFE
jgi:uncharacterized protein